MADAAGNQPVRIFAGELLGIEVGLRTALFEDDIAREAMSPCARRGCKNPSPVAVNAAAPVLAIWRKFRRFASVGSDIIVVRSFATTL